MKKSAISLLFSCILTQTATAGVCEYRPSQLFGNTTTAVAAGGAGAAAAAGVGLKAAGFYALTHSVTGAAMLGSTAAGASAAGTAGIIAGSAGFLGTVGAVILSPLVIIPAAVTALGVGAYEGGCYLSEK